MVTARFHVREYVLGEPLGRGGSSTVFRARRGSDPIEVALKLVPGRNASDADLFAHYRRLADLSHPNLVPILEVGEIDDSVYVVMPLADAGSLRDRLRNRPDWPVPRVATRLIRQVAAGLQHLHDHAIVHHDVKPSNILLLRSDDVWLADCGSSRVRGTPAYMSPEQCESRDVAPESDQYGLAVLSYLLLTGRLPFTGSTEQLLHQHVVAPPPPPREVCPSLPAAVERVLLNGLAKTPAARYPTVTAFAFALEQAVGAARWQLADGIAPPDDRTLEAATLEARPSPLSASDSGSGSASALASPPPSRPA